MTKPNVTGERIEDVTNETMVILIICFQIIGFLNNNRPVMNNPEIIMLEKTTGNITLKKALSGFKLTNIGA